MYEENNNCSSDFSRIYLRSIHWITNNFLYMLQNALWNHRKIFLVVGITSIGLLLSTNIVLGATETIDETVGSPSVNIRWGEASATQSQKISQSWIAPDTYFVCSVGWVTRLSSGTATDDVYTTVYSGGSEPEDGVLVSTATVSGSDIPAGGLDYVTWTFDNCFSIASGTTYYFVQSRQTLDDTNTYETYRSGSLTTGTAYDYIPNSGGWNEQAGIADLFIKISGVEYPFYLTSTDGVIGTTTLNKTIFTTYLDEALPNLNCDSYDSLFASTTMSTLGCNVRSGFNSFVKFLVEPATSTIAYFNNTVDTFRTRFPFSIIYDSLDIFYGLTIDEIDQTTIVFPELVSPTNNRTVVDSFTVVSSTTVSNYVGSSLWDDIRQVETYAIWLFLGIGIINVTKKTYL
jgi:hypothetical protein